MRSEQRPMTDGVAGVPSVEVADLLGEGGRTGSLRRLLTAAAAGTFGLKVAGVVLTFGVNVLLARLLGASGYGVYAYVFAWMNLCALVAIAGMDRLVVREISAGLARRDYALMHGILRWVDRAMVTTGLIAGGAMAVTAWLLHGGAISPVVLAFWAAAPIVPISALSMVRDARLRGLHRVALGQMSELLVKPALLAAFIGGLYVAAQAKLTPATALGLHAVAAAGALGLNAVLARRRTPAGVGQAEPVFKARLWWSCAAPLLLVGGLRMVNMKADTIMVFSLDGQWAAGVYATASRASMFVTFVLMSVGAALTPMISRLYAQGDLRRLQQVITKAARGTMLATVPVAAALILLRGPVLRLFGPDYVHGQTALVLLICGQCVNAAAGAVAPLLMMTGHERHAAAGCACGAGLNILLNALLIPRLGLNGAAVATAISTTGMSIVLGWFVWRDLGVDPTPLGATRREGGGRA